MILVKFYDLELKEYHFGFATQDKKTVSCACCGTEFEIGDDALIIETFPWLDIEDSLKEKIAKLPENLEMSFDPFLD